eukprot:gene9577-12900_t
MLVITLTNGYQLLKINRVGSSIKRTSSNQYKSSSLIQREKGFILFADPDERRITRENEGEYFESEFDRKPLKERLPFAFAFLAAVSTPFIIGLIFLFLNK